MNRRAFLLSLALVLVAPLTVEAQQAAKVHRIGYLSLATAEVDKGWIAAFRQGLRELGYVEGQTILIELRHAAGRPERLSGLAAELVRLKVDVVVVYGGVRAVQAVKQATSTIPIVLAVSADPVGQGLVASLARPGGQVTGLSDFHGSLVPKRLELLKDLAPSASRIALLLNPANPGALLQAKDIRAAAPAVGVTVFSVEVRGSALTISTGLLPRLGKSDPMPCSSFPMRRSSIARDTSPSWRSGTGYRPSAP